MSTSDKPAGYQDRTKLTHSGNRPGENYGIVNPPVYHASTVLFPTVADMRAKLAGIPGLKAYPQVPPAIRIGGRQ